MNTLAATGRTIFGIDIEALVAGPYLELFSRQSAPGWNSFGDEV